MPRMGTSVAEGTILEWRVAVGDVVARDEVLCEVSTDKVDVECPAPRDGVVAELLVEAGETVEAGTVIARMRDASDGGLPGGSSPGEVSPDLAATTGEHRPVGAARDAGTSGPDAPLAPGRPVDHPRADRRELLRRSSPVAARLAAEHGIDVLGLAGSGRNGRVTKRDVLAAASAPLAAALMHTESPYRHDPSIPVAGSTGAATSGVADASLLAPGTTTGGGPSSLAHGAPPVVPGARPVVPSDLGGVPVPPSRMRRAIGDAVRRSLDTAAHCTTVVECDMGRIERERRELGLTALPLVAHHTIQALRAFPALNATSDDGSVTRYGDRVHLGIAVSLGEDGLIAPVIHDAQDLSVQGLARRIKDLAARARAGTLAPDEVRGGTFTITNPGAAGALMATPVINQPQVAILDLEAIVRRPVVVTDADGGESIGIRPMVHLCMGWDHRALDGLYAAQFLTALRRRLEG
nr:dihydrolipoamide acetyltransferase family protein [Patulibacter minatonensis]